MFDKQNVIYIYIRDYEELLVLVESYIMSLSFSKKYFLESDSLVVVTSLFGRFVDFSEFETLVITFSSLDR